MESPRTIISFLLVGQSYANAASGVVYIWYHFTTLQEEVDLFWKAGYSSACVLFLANRYLALVLAGYSLGWMDSVYALDTPHGIVFQSCVAVAVSKAALNALQYAVWAAFSALRTHALGQRRARTALVAVLSLVPVFSLSAQAAYIHPATRRDATGRGCITLTQDIPPSMLFTLVNFVPRMSVVIADGIVVIVTWTATYRTRSEGAPALLGRKTLLSDVLLRNGSIYFVVLTVLNILHLAFSLGSIAFADARMLPSSVVGWFTGPLTSILLSAFLADLRAAAREGWRTESGSEWSSVAFGIGSGMREEGDSDGQDAEIRMAHSGSPDGELTTDAEGWRSA